MEEGYTVSVLSLIKTLLINHDTFQNKCTYEQSRMQRSALPADVVPLPSVTL
jgi:hypothetical protein